VARVFTIFMVYFLAIQRVISVSGSLVTGTRAESKRRLHGTIACPKLSRSYFNESCMLFEDITKHKFSILDYKVPADTAPITVTTEVLADSKPAASYTAAYLTAWLS